MTQEDVREETQKDIKLQVLMKAIQTGNWNNSTISEYVQIKDELSVYNGLILRDHRLIIPEILQKRLSKLLTKVIKA